MSYPTGVFVSGRIYTKLQTLLPFVFRRLTVVTAATAAVAVMRVKIDSDVTF